MSHWRACHAMPPVCNRCAQPRQTPRRACAARILSVDRACHVVQMASAIEALGMSLPYSSSLPAEDPMKRVECRLAGRCNMTLASPRPALHDE